MMAETILGHSYQAVVASPLPGRPAVGLRIETGCIIAIDYLWQSGKIGCQEKQAPLCTLLEDYFQGETVDCGSALKPVGTAFQQRVWQRLMQITPGTVMTYGALADELDSSPRAVAGACRANPIPILIPCHRVIAATGPGGYLGKTAGRELAIKQWLLQHEGHV